MDFLKAVFGVVLLAVSSTTIPVASTTVEVATTTVKSQKEEIVEYIGNTFPEDKRLMLRVAQCESNLNPKATTQLSSAKGIYQIINGTWKHFECDGNPLNYKDNIDCAYKIYSSVGGLGHWSESFHCWKKIN